MPCAISMPRPIFIAVLAFTSARATGIRWGTHNHIVQFPGLFHRVADARGAGEIAPRRVLDDFSFGAFNRDFLTRERGLSLLILEWRDAASDADDISRRRALAISMRCDFEREGKRPDGTPVKFGFRCLRTKTSIAPTFISRRASSTIRRISGIRRFRSIPIRRQSGRRRCAGRRGSGAVTRDFLRAFAGADADTQRRRRLCHHDAARRQLRF